MKNKIGQKTISLIMLSAFVITNLASAMAVARDLPYTYDEDSHVRPVIRSTSNSKSMDVKSPVKINNADSIVNLSLRDADITQVLRMFADQAGMNIIFASNLDDTVTMDLIDITLEQALDLVVATHNVFYDIQGNTIVISNKDNRISVSAKNLDIIPVKYVGASTIANFLNKNIFTKKSTHPGLSKTAVVTVNPATNELIVMGTESDAIMAKRFVEQFDRKPAITTFKVNHTTPAEMANMICNTLLPATTGASGGDNNGGGGTGGSGSTGAPEGDSRATGFAAGVPTGFASDEGDSSSDGGGEGGGSTGGSISVGGGKLVCTVEMGSSGSEISALQFKNMSVSYFPTLGTIQIIGGSQSQIDMIREYIAENDKKSPQAYLEVQLISLTESGSKSFDNTWSYLSKNFSFNAGGGSGISTNTMFPVFFTGKGYYLTDGTWDDASQSYKITGRVGQWTGSQNLMYAMNYLIQNDKARVLANPKILITSGQASKIDLTSDYVSKVTTEYLDGSSYASQVQKQYEIGSDQGITINITPFISPDGYVTLDITPEYSTIKQKLYTPSSGSDGALAQVTDNDLVATLLQRRNLELKGIRIKDGETLVIGGLIQESESKSITKIPFLGDLPVIGMFFRSTSTSRDKEEMVIMITPTIIVDTEDSVGTDIAL